MSNATLTQSNKSLAEALMAPRSPDPFVSFSIHQSSALSAPRTQPAPGVRPAPPTQANSLCPSSISIDDQLQRCLSAVNDLAYSLTSAISVWNGGYFSTSLDIHKQYAEVSALVNTIPTQFQCKTCSRQVTLPHMGMRFQGGIEGRYGCKCWMPSSGEQVWEPVGGGKVQDHAGEAGPDEGDSVVRAAYLARPQTYTRQQQQSPLPCEDYASHDDVSARLHLNIGGRRKARCSVPPGPQLQYFPPSPADFDPGRDQSERIVPAEDFSAQQQKSPLPLENPAPATDTSLDSKPLSKRLRALSDFPPEIRIPAKRLRVPDTVPQQIQLQLQQEAQQLRQRYLSASSSDSAMSPGDAGQEMTPGGSAVQAPSWSERQEPRNTVSSSADCQNDTQIEHDTQPEQVNRSNITAEKVPTLHGAIGDFKSTSPVANASERAAAAQATQKNYALQAHRMQLTLLEQANKRKRLMARQEQLSTTQSPSRPEAQPPGPDDSTKTPGKPAHHDHPRIAWTPWLPGDSSLGSAAERHTQGSAHPGVEDMFKRWFDKDVVDMVLSAPIET